MAKTEMTPQQKAAATRKRKAAEKAARRARDAGEERVKAEAEGMTPTDGTLPVLALLCCYHARRKIWKPGRTISIGGSGGRGGVKPALMITGSRTGDLPWRREDDADVLAEDWEVIDPAGDVTPDAA